MNDRFGALTTATDGDSTIRCVMDKTNDGAASAEEARSKENSPERMRGTKFTGVDQSRVGPTGADIDGLTDIWPRMEEDGHSKLVKKRFCKVDIVRTMG